VHKRNRKRRSWYQYGTPEVGEEFFKTHPTVAELWQEHVLAMRSSKLHIYEYPLNSC